MANLDIIIRAQNLASSVLRQVQSDVGALGRAAGGLRQGFDGLQKAMGAGLVAGAASGALALGGMAAGLGAVVKGGLDVNTSLENVEAQLLAFTKSGDVAKSILNDIRVEAARTPFAFEEMARATASLLPAAKQSNVALMDLVKQAEILAASNPEQGLEGAAFALKEALSGDFMSIVERFNLPRQRLNQLKEEGVPAIEAVSIAMREMGLDADLVANMAQTASGRWSTFWDTIDTLKATISQPIFDLIKEGLIGVQTWLDNNMGRLQELATLFGERLAGALRIVGVAVQDVWQYGFSALFTSFEDGSSHLSALLELFGLSEERAQELANSLFSAIDAVQSIVGPVAEAIAAFVSWRDVLIALGIVAIPVLWGIVAPILPIIAALGALVAAVALVRNAWESDFGGIRTALTNWWEQTGQPIFERLQVWLAENLPVALAGLRQLWEDNLLPAIKAVWAFIDKNIIPLFQALARVWIAAVRAELAILGEIFERVLLPILRAVWAFISDYILPIFDGMGDSIDIVTDAIQTAVDWLNRLADTLGSIDFSNPFAGWKLPSVSIPGFAMGTSYAPGGLALVGERGPELVNLPRGAQVYTANETRQVLASGSAAPTSGGQNYQITINQYNTVRDEIDIAALTERILSELRRRSEMQAWQPTF